MRGERWGKMSDVIEFFFLLGPYCLVDLALFSLAKVQTIFRGEWMGERWLTLGHSSAKFRKLKRI